MFLSNAGQWRSSKTTTTTKKMFFYKHWSANQNEKNKKSEIQTKHTKRTNTQLDRIGYFASFYFASPANGIVNKSTKK